MQEGTWACISPTVTVVPRADPALPLFCSCPECVTRTGGLADCRGKGPGGDQPAGGLAEDRAPPGFSHQARFAAHGRGFAHGPFCTERPSCGLRLPQRGPAAPGPRASPRIVFLKPADFWGCALPRSFQGVPGLFEVSIYSSQVC